MDEKKMAPLHGLVLAGGKSLRMGLDKATLFYHQKPQVEHLFGLLSALMPNVYVSIDKGHAINFTDHIIEDQSDERRPVNGILSAFEHNPRVAWLVMAVDLPLLSTQELKTLIASRNPSTIVTALSTKEASRPEPLAAIWEPGAYALLKKEIASFGYSPSRFLSAHECTLVTLPDDTALLNANQPADREKAMRLIAKSTEE